jgi:hypothetical protein
MIPVENGKSVKALCFPGTNKKKPVRNGILPSIAFDPRRPRHLHYRHPRNFPRHLPYRHPRHFPRHFRFSRRVKNLSSKNERQHEASLLCIWAAKKNQNRL